MNKLTEMCLLILSLSGAIRCSFLEELREAYTRDCENSEERTNQEIKLIKCHRSLLRAKYCKYPKSKLPTADALSVVYDPTKKTKRRRISKWAIEPALATATYSLLICYLSHRLASIHQVSKKMESKPFYHYSNLHRTRTWKYVKWTHAYAVMKREKHERCGNDAQYKFLEKHRENIIPKISRWQYLSGIPRELSYVCVKIMQYILADEFNQADISESYILSQIHGLDNVVGGITCIHKSSNVSQRFAFQITTLTEPPNYFVLLDASVTWIRRWIGRADGRISKTLLVDIVQLSDESELKDRSLVFNTIENSIRDSTVENQNENDPNSTVENKNENDPNSTVENKNENDQNSTVENRNENDQNSTVENKNENDQNSTVENQNDQNSTVGNKNEENDRTNIASTSGTSAEKAFDEEVHEVIIID